MVAKRKKSSGLFPHSSSGTRTLGGLGSSEKQPKPPQKRSNKKVDISPAIVIAAAALLVVVILMIALLPTGSANKANRKARTESQVKPKIEEKKLPDIDPRPSRPLPSGQIGDWAKSVVYIEGGSVNWTARKFNRTQTGTGFVISSTGKMLTNHHVIDGASVIVVTFFDGSWKLAKVVKSDKDLDVALLKVDDIPKGVPSLNLSSSKDVRIGRRILVMGFPLGAALGTEMTLTDGLISSIRHNQTKSIMWYQISAPVNPGNSGGPLLDEQTGEVLGIVTSKIKKAEMIAFARPLFIIKDLFLN